MTAPIDSIHTNRLKGAWKVLPENIFNDKYILSSLGLAIRAGIRGFGVYEPVGVFGVWRTGFGVLAGQVV